MQATTVSPAKLLNLPLSALTTAPQVRTTMEKDALAELAADMRTNGVLEPILVRPVGKNRYRIIAGHRRAAAAAMAELTTVPAVIREATDEEAMMMQLSENIHREDLTTTDLANAVRRLFDALGTLDAVAAFTMKSKAWCSKHLALTLPEYSWKAIDAIENGVTEDLEVVGIIHQVHQLCRYPHNDEAVDQLVASIKNGFSRDQCRAYLKELKVQRAAKAELDAAKAKLQATATKKKPANFKPTEKLAALYFDARSGDAKDSLDGLTKEEQDAMLALVVPFHAQGVADRIAAANDAAKVPKGQSTTLALWPLVMNASILTRGWEFTAYVGGLMGADLTTLNNFFDQGFSFLTDSLIPPVLTNTNEATKK